MSENKPLPNVSCNKCYLIQAYRGQKHCIHCGKKLQEWRIKPQLQAQERDHNQ